MSLQMQTLDKEGTLKWREGTLRDVRVVIKKGHLSVHKRNEVVTKMIKEMVIFNERKVEVDKSSSKLGMQIKGGLKSNSPIMIVSLFDGGAAKKCGQLAVGDVLLHVNDEPLLDKDHAIVLKLLGVPGKVHLHVVSAVEKKVKEPNCGRDEDEEEEEEEGRKQDADLSADILRAVGEGAWVLIDEGSLTLSSITAYRRENNIPMPNAFSVSLRGKESSLVLNCSPQNNEKILEWTEAMSTNILAMNAEEVQRLKQNFDLSDLVFFSWVYELVPASKTSNVWIRKFLVLRENSLQIYDKYPEGVADWQRPECSHKLIDIFMKTLDKSNIPNLRSCSILVQTPNENNHTLSFEFPTPYNYWIKQISCARYLSVMKLKSISFKGSWNKRFVNFILDLEKGFIMQDHTTEVIYWQIPFSELTDSNDNGFSTLYLEFNKNRKENIEVREFLRCLYSIEAFMSTKVYQNNPEYPIVKA